MDGGMTPNLKPKVPPKKVHEVVPPTQVMMGGSREHLLKSTMKTAGQTKWPPQATSARGFCCNWQDQYCQYSPPRPIWDQPELSPEMLEWSRGSVCLSVSQSSRWCSRLWVPPRAGDPWHCADSFLEPPTEKELRL